MTIISLHLPKTAGTSFKTSLESHFGDRFCTDYGDAAISKSPIFRGAQALVGSIKIAERGLGGIQCVHGHFLPIKYGLLGFRSPLTFVTWMRDPAMRMLSHYYYWQDSYDALASAPHHRQVIEQGWTLEQFCFSERFRNIYKQYLWGFPLEKFAFVGISEHYAEDLQDFSRQFLGTEMQVRHQNATKYASRRHQVSEAFLREVRDFHSADTRLYQQALERRAERRRVQHESGKCHSATA